MPRLRPISLVLAGSVLMMAVAIADAAPVRRALPPDRNPLRPAVLLDTAGVTMPELAPAEAREIVAPDDDTTKVPAGLQAAARATATAKRATGSVVPPPVQNPYSVVRSLRALADSVEADVAELGGAPPLPERSPLAEPRVLRRAAADHAGSMPLPERKPVVPTPEAKQPTSAMLLPERNPERLGTLRGSLAGQGQAGQPEPPRAPTWTEAEIAEARLICTRVIAETGAVARLLPPIRQGACGTPQPVELSSIGSKPRVRIEPPAIINCPMLVALQRWIEGSVQPSARARFGGPVLGIANATAYACRNRYNAPGEKLSEHAFANALDISTFVIEGGRRVTVADGWGSTARDVAAAMAAKAAQPTPVPSTAGTAGIDVAAAAGTTGPTAGAGIDDTVNAGIDWATTTTTVASLTAAAGKRRRKNGPPEGIQRPVPTTPEAQFLHTVHEAACGLFGTVLGPEANSAHVDHFHLDLAKRRSSAYCQ